MHLLASLRKPGSQYTRCFCYRIWLIALISPSLADIRKECNTHVPRPTNLTLSTTKPGQCNLTWHWSSAEEPWKEPAVKFDIEVKEGPTSKWKLTRVTSMKLKINISLHKGLSFRASAFINKTCSGHVSDEIHYTPEGVNETAADNVSCVAYNTSSMNCMWIAGVKAPENTRYNLTLMQKEVVETCHPYQRDSLGRDSACRLHNLKIQLNETTYILIEGQSSNAKIQFYDEWFTPFETEVLNPPSNIKVLVDSENLTVQWKQPQTSYYAEDYCFKYEMAIQEKIYTPAYDEESLTLPIHSFKEGEKYILKMRARGYDCGFSDNWGEWSRPITISIPAQDYWYTLVTILGIIGASVLSSLLLVCLCKRFKVKQKIWPPIPQPKKSLYAFEKQFINITEVICEENSSHPEGGIHNSLITIDFDNMDLR